VLARDQYTCQLCFSPNWHLMDLVVDHIIPASLGGTTTMNNLRTVCRYCDAVHQKRLSQWHNRFGSNQHYWPEHRPRGRMKPPPA
jgi:5-methylcytosine-specific restriction endonuclease McrA